MKYKFEELQALLDALPLKRVKADLLISARLTDEGLADQDLLLTEKGLALAEELKKRDDQLRQGIYLGGKFDIRRKQIADETWLWSSFLKKNWISNEEFIFVGKKVEVEVATSGSIEYRKHFPSIVRRATLFKKQTRLLPYVHQGDGLFSKKWVWLADEKFDLVSAVQAKYVEFCFSRFPSIQFFGVGIEKPVLVKNFSGLFFRDTVAIIGPFLTGDYKIPERRVSWGEDWEQIMSGEKVPSVGDGGGSSLRGEDEQLTSTDGG